MNPVGALAEYLDKLGIGVYRTSGVYADNEIAIYPDFMEPSPDQVIVISTEMTEPSDSKLKEDEPLISIRVRGTANAHVSRDRAMAIYNALHGLAREELSGILFELMICQNGGPTYLGRDDNKRHTHQVLVNATIFNPDRLGVSHAS